MHKLIISSSLKKLFKEEASSFSFVWFVFLPCFTILIMENERMVESNASSFYHDEHKLKEELVVYGKSFLTPPTTISSQINSTWDDVEEEGPTGTNPGVIYATSGDIELTYDLESPTTGNQKVGLRFNGLNIPQGTTITNAYIDFTAESADSPNDNTSETKLLIKAEASDNAPAIPNTIDYITNRTLTSASAVWKPVSWVTGSVYATPDLTTVVQELVDRSGWVTTNSSMLFIIVGDGSRTAASYDGASSDAPVLYISFSLPSEICNDGIDNDGDGQTDCADSDCCCAQAPTLLKN